MRKGRREDMENGRRKVWICLLVIVLAAVVVGILYYLSSPQQPSDEGFLIREPEVEEYVSEYSDSLY